jgi:hypothetical protein
MSAPVPWTIDDRPSRAEIARYIPRHYSASLHILSFTVAGALGALGIARSLHGVSARQWLAIPATLMAGNLLEYVAHRWFMHRRTPLLGAAYDAHTLRHHLFYTSDAMSIDSPRDVWLILFSAKDVAILVLCALPLFLVLRAAVSPNLFALALLTSIAHFVGYEWLHLAYHLPDGSWATRLPIVSTLRRYHRTHHRLDEMGRRHFNVSLPLCDFAFATFREPAKIDRQQ